MNCAKQPCKLSFKLERTNKLIIMFFGLKNEKRNKSKELKEKWAKGMDGSEPMCHSKISFNWCLCVTFSCYAQLIYNFVFIWSIMFAQYTHTHTRTSKYETSTKEGKMERSDRDRKRPRQNQREKGQQRQQKCSQINVPFAHNQNLKSAACQRDYIGSSRNSKIFNVSSSMLAR